MAERAKRITQLRLFLQAAGLHEPWAHLDGCIGEGFDDIMRESNGDSWRETMDEYHFAVEPLLEHKQPRWRQYMLLSEEEREELCEMSQLLTHLLCRCFAAVQLRNLTRVVSARAPELAACHAACHSLALIVALV